MSDDIWALEETSRGRYCRYPALARLGLAHGFSCRDLGPGPEGLLAAALHLENLPRAALRQQHTPLVHRVGGRGPQPRPAPVGDALVAQEAGWALRLQTADCLPILLLNPHRSHYAAVHAGWRGTLSGVLGAAARALSVEGSASLDSAWMAIGPGIRACCLEVGEEVADGFRVRWDAADSWLQRRSGRRPHLDLAAANVHQAVQAGLQQERILDPGLCTHCRTDLFFSHRADGGSTGRIITLAGIPEGEDR
jgi:YfiH family protein